MQMKMPLKQQSSLLLLLSLGLILPLAQTRIEVAEDRDLTGCSVELNSYIFNLHGL